MARKLQILATHNDDLVSGEDLFCDDRCQSAQKVAAAVNDDSLKREINQLGYVDHKQIAFLIEARRYSAGLLNESDQEANCSIIQALYK